jgi:hypothetical protein
MMEVYMDEVDRYVEHGLWLQEMDACARNVAVGLLAVGIHAAWDPDNDATPHQHSLHAKRPEYVLRAAGLWRE